MESDSRLFNPGRTRISRLGFILFSRASGLKHGPKMKLPNGLKPAMIPL
jgi:hypothetical protein